MQLYVKLREALKRCAERHGACSSLASSDVVLALEVSTEGGQRPAAVCFLDMRLASSQSGPHAPAQTFLRLNPVGDGPAPLLQDCAGVVLRYTHLERVQHDGQPREPMRRGALGAVVGLTEDDVCGIALFELLPHPAGLRSRCTAVKRVVIQELAYDDLTLRDIRVQGPSATFQALEVEAEAVARPRPARRADFLDLSDIFHEARGPRAPPAALPRQQAREPPALEGLEQRMLESLGLQAGDVLLSDAERRELAGEEVAPEMQEQVEAILDLLGDAQDEANQEEADEDGEARPPAPGAEPRQAFDQNKWSHLGLTEQQHWEFWSADGAPRGRIHFVNGAGSMKATCRAHAKCACWLSNVTDVSKTEAELVAWIAERVDRDGHQLSAYNLKLTYGMRPRPP